MVEGSRPIEIAKRGAAEKGYSWLEPTHGPPGDHPSEVGKGKFSRQPSMDPAGCGQTTVWTVESTAFRLRTY